MQSRASKMRKIINYMNATYKPNQEKKHNHNITMYYNAWEVPETNLQLLLQLQQLRQIICRILCLEMLIQAKKSGMGKWYD